MGNLSAIFEGGSHLSDFASLILLSPIFFLWCLFHVSQMHLPACTSFFLPSLLLPFFPYQVHNPSYRVQYQTNITFNVIFFLFPTRCSSIATFCFCYMYVAWKRKKKKKHKTPPNSSSLLHPSSHDWRPSCVAGKKDVPYNLAEEP